MMVKQITPSDCFAACVAMALGMRYSVLRRKMGRALWDKIRKHGTGFQDTKALLAKCGLHYEHDYWVYFPSNHLVQTHFLRVLLNGRRAIVSVNSKNNRDGQHAIYWDGARLFDPSPRKTYAWDEVEANQIVIFNERST